MGRVINPEGVGKERTRLIRGIVLALRELMQQNETNAYTRDLAAFIAQALLAVGDTVEISVQAWEKRDYWLKADRFRMEWSWAGRLGKAMKDAVLAEDWSTVAMTSAQVAQRLKDVDVPKRNNIGAPWEGAYRRLAS